MKRYAGKKAVITGGTHGMGLATVKALVDGGAEVLLTGWNERNVEAARRELGAKARVARSDTASLADIDALAALVRRELRSGDAAHGATLRSERRAARSAHVAHTPAAARRSQGKPCPCPPSLRPARRSDAPA